MGMGDRGWGRRRRGRCGPIGRLRPHPPSPLPRSWYTRGVPSTLGTSCVSASFGWRFLRRSSPAPWWRISMRIIRNTEYIKNRRRRARLAAGLWFLLLMSVWAIWFYPTFIVFAYGFLILGYLVFSYGMAQMGKWNRTPRADNILDERLKPLPDKFTLIHYATLGKHTVEHMLVHPGGVVALTARAIPGTI